MVLKLKNKIVPTTDYQVPTKKIKYVLQGEINSNDPHVQTYDLIHTSTSNIYISTHPSNQTLSKKPHRNLVLHTRSKYPTQLANMSFDEILDVTAGFFSFTINAIQKRYTSARILENK